MDKKGLELSINFMVMLILTLVVFVGITFIAKNIVDSTYKVKAELDKETEQRLVDLITSGSDEVVIAFYQKEVKISKTENFGVGILNNLGSEMSFRLNVTGGIAVKSDGTEIESDDWDKSWKYVYLSDIGTLKNNDYTTVPILIRVGNDAVRGATYVINVKVESYDGTNWIPYPMRSPINKIRVKVI